jgi:hypothetical protein
MYNAIDEFYTVGPGGTLAKKFLCAASMDLNMAGTYLPLHTEKQY